MNRHKTYDTLKRGYLGDVDYIALTYAKNFETNPFILYAINEQLGVEFSRIDWDTESFCKNFRSGNPRERLDETVFSFLLRFAAIVTKDAHDRTFTKPETFTAWLAWVHALKYTIYSVLSLAYNINWTIDQFTYLDECIIDLIHKGQAYALRKLVDNLGITITKDVFPAEIHYVKLSGLRVEQFSSFYWRLLHWMAEAHNIRENLPHAKKIWRELVVGPLYRSLICGICMTHIQQKMKILKSKLLDESENHPRIWFDIHNEIHQERRVRLGFINEPDYLESEYEVDAEFMRQALLQE